MDNAVAYLLNYSTEVPPGGAHLMPPPERPRPARSPRLADRSPKAHAMAVQTLFVPATATHNLLVDNFSHLSLATILEALANTDGYAAEAEGGRSAWLRFFVVRCPHPFPFAPTEPCQFWPRCRCLRSTNRVWQCCMFASVTECASAKSSASFEDRLLVRL